MTASLFHPTKSCPTCGRTLFTAFQSKPPASPCYIVFCMKCGLEQESGKGETEFEAVADYHRKLQPQAEHAKLI